MIERDILLDFVTHPHWSTVFAELDKLIITYTRDAARCETEDHAVNKGRMEGAERARLVLETWRTATKKELANAGRQA